MKDYISDRGNRSDSLRSTIKKSFDSATKSSATSKLAKKPIQGKKPSEGEKIVQISAVLGVPEGNRVVNLSPKPPEGKDIPEGASYAVKDPDKPIEVTPGSGKGTKANVEHWGYHLVVDIASSNENIDSNDAIIEFLTTMVVELKMRAIGNPIVLDVSGQEGRGITGIQFLTTSHISIHTDDDHRTAYIDVFSCAPYDHNIALKHIQKTFKPKQIGYLWLFRDSGSWPRK